MSLGNILQFFSGASKLPDTRFESTPIISFQMKNVYHMHLLVPSASYFLGPLVSSHMMNLKRKWTCAFWDLLVLVQLETL